MKLDVIICSTRPGRVGLPIAQWMHDRAIADGQFESELIDLATIGLPLYNEAKHPSLQQYEHDHTKRWSAVVDAADAFVFVTPEYNHGPPPAFVNAVNYVYKEWNYKPAALVTYGGVSGGLRAAQSEKLILSTLKLVTILESVTIPMVQQHMHEGLFQPNEFHTQSATALLRELHKWSNALKPMRTTFRDQV